MPQFGRKTLSYFLLLCLTVSTFPWDLLHRHQSDFKFIQSGEIIDNVECLNGIYLPDYLKLIDCGHSAHIDQEESCELCDLFISRHHKYFDGVTNNVQQLEIFEEVIIFIPLSYTKGVERLLNSRGPPA